jgi:hydroxymethylbilane synthase
VPDAPNPRAADAPSPHPAVAAGPGGDGRPGKLVIGSRGSALARWQSEHTAALLRERHPELSVEIIIIVTAGDRILDAPLSRIGGKGLFTKEIEEALLDGRADVAVHSLKDLPTTLPAGLALGAVLSRHEPSDALISARGERFADLPPGARIGTSSLRRRAQVLHARPDLAVETIRGNVPTRLKRAAPGDMDAVILARAGVERLGLGAHITEILSAELLLPAPGQGAIGIEIRRGDTRVQGLLAGLQDPTTRAAVDAERAFLRALGGGCQVPVGALARVDGADLHLDGMVADPDGVRLLRGTRAGRADDAASIGEQLAQELIGLGAAEILAEVEQAASGGGTAESHADRQRTAVVRGLTEIPAEGERMAIAPELMDRPDGGPAAGPRRKGQA